jgi:hypothetical protein
LLQNRWDYFRCRNSAIFSSVISPSPEIRLISRSFLLMVSAKPLMAVRLMFCFWEKDGSVAGVDFCMDFINKGYKHNVYIPYFMRSA